MKNQLKQIQNENGGGLSVELTGKYTSVRHELAKESGKLTAGQSAKELSKILKTKISAKELVEAYTLLNGCEPEWHHAGFYKGSNGSRMGRTFFFKTEDLEDVVKRWDEVEIKLLEKKAEREAKFNTVIKGFYYSWTSDLSGRNGRKRNYKVLEVYEGNELQIPKNFIKCNNSEFEVAKKMEGKAYYGWDEPTISEFQN